MEQKVSKILNKAISRRTFKYVAYVLCGVISAALSVLFAFATKNLVNSIETLGGSAPVEIPVIILVAVVCLLFIFSVLTRLLGDGVCVQAETQLRKYVFSKFILGDYSSIKKVKTGDFLARLEGDVVTVASVRANLLPSIISTAVRLLGTVAALFILQPTLTVIILLASALLIAVSFVIRKTSARLHLKTRKSSSSVTSYASEVVDNSLAVKAFSAESYAEHEFSKKLFGYKKAKLNYRYFNSAVSSVISLAFTAFYAAAVIVGVIGIKNGNANLTFGSIIASLQLLLQIKAPVTGISGFFTARQEMLVSAERLAGILVDSDKKLEVADFDKVVFDNVSFAYEDEEVLQGVNLTVNKGDKIVIKGASGEGKTTLIKLLMGLYVPSEGSVTVYGETQTAAGSVKGLCSFLPQGNMVFSGTVKENVVFCNEYDETRYNLAINAANLNGVLDKDVQVGQNGSLLSEGQAQRVALARAVYANKPILVLDEPTSALDAQTEELVLKEIFAIPKLTVVIITHKPAAEKYAHKTITFKDGKLI